MQLRTFDRYEQMIIDIEIAHTSVQHAEGEAQNYVKDLRSSHCELCPVLRESRSNLISTTLVVVRSSVRTYVTINTLIVLKRISALCRLQ